MKCPRCQTGISDLKDRSGYMVCSGCGARLRRTAAQGANVTLPPGTPMARNADASKTLAVADGTLGPRPVPAPAAKAAKAVSAAAAPRRVGDDTARMKAVAAPAPVAPFAPPAGNGPATAASLEAVLAEVRGVRKVQEEILEMLRARGPFRGAAGASGALDDAFEGMHEPAVRSSKRKSALLVDDDPATRQALEAVLQAGEVPVRSVGDGNSALAAIATDKPDVIVLELGIGGAMAGKDVVNMIKATMEWVDIPIILYTRVAMEGQKEARQIHGADDFVAKGAGGPEAVLAKAIAFFRKS